MKNFNFNISLSVLNHLGRNLYRNFITVIGEAISNSWDADASTVWIEIDRENRFMSIVDDGVGIHGERIEVIYEVLYVVYLELVVYTVNRVEAEGVYRGVGAVIFHLFRTEAGADADGEY